MDARRRLTWLLGCLLLVLSTGVALKYRNAFGAVLDTAEAHAADSATPASSAREATQPPLRVLFVGNSLTAANDMPAMIARLAQAAKQPRRFEYQSDTPGGVGFSEHAAAGIEQALQHGPWDSVVLQDQGQSMGWRAEQLEAHSKAPARALDRAIRAAGAKTVFYMTCARRDGDRDSFPSDSYELMQDRIANAYTQLAIELSAGLVPAGAIWKLTNYLHPWLQLWAQDGVHPSVAGSYLVACAFYMHFYRASPVGNPYRANLSPADAELIQRHVEDVIQRSRSAP